MTNVSDLKEPQICPFCPSKFSIYKEKIEHIASLHTEKLCEKLNQQPNSFWNDDDKVE